MQAERRKNSRRSHQQDFLGPSRACRCSSSRLPFCWHRSPGLLTSMRRSTYHRYLFYPRPTRASAGVKVATLLMVVLLWSSSWQSNLFQETFFLLFTSWNCSAASANCDAGSSFSIFVVLHNGGQASWPIAFTVVLRSTRVPIIRLPLHGFHATQLWKVE